MGDMYPSAKWRRPGLYQPSMNWKMAMRASALVWNLRLSSNSLATHFPQVLPERSLETRMLAIEGRDVNAN
jgi:hypothetical protein